MASTEGASSAGTGSAVSSILESYSKLHSRRVDVIGDYAGNELFLIEGDSLLLHCFGDERIDFDPGFQLLHATYTVESFLRDLVSRRSNFHIAFFDEHHEMCIPPFVSAAVREKYLLARAAIIRHLLVNLRTTHPDIEIHLFSSVQSEEFALYLKRTDLFFVMCHDGASMGPLRKSEALKDEGNGSQEYKLRSKTRFRLLIFWFMQRGYNTVLANGMEWRDTKAIASVLENPRYIDVDVDALMQAKSKVAQTNSESSPQWRPNLEKIKSAIDNDLTEREYLTVLVASKLNSQDTAKISASLLRHTALLSQLPLSERRFPSITPSSDVAEFLSSLYSELRTILTSGQWKTDIQGLSLQCDVADLVDGRLLAACLQDPALGASSEPYKLLRRAVSCLSEKAPLDDTTSASSTTHIDATGFNKTTTSQAYAVLPFSNEVLDKHLAPVQLAVDSVGDVTDATSATIFHEVAHWHSSKRPADPKLREESAARSQKQQFFARRRNQWFMAEMMAYAASLTNAVGKVLEPEIITTGSKGKFPSPAVSESEEKSKTKFNPKSGKKSEPTRKQAMLAKIAADRSRKEEASSDKILQGWKMTCKNIEQDQSPVAQYEEAKRYLLTLNTDLKRETLEAEVKFYMLNVLLSMWVSFSRQDSREKGLHLAALIFDSIRSFANVKGLTKTIATHLKTTVKLLELPPLSIPTPEGDRALSFSFALSTPPASVTIPLANKQFQLLHCGPYFERSMDSAPDPRTPFDPDAWQRRVLDGIDDRRSLLVIAPTSAGKTFISFYAMEQVLKSSDDDVLVYVAPTKALVNQIAAEVQARFSKRYNYAGNSVWGIHTRDYRINNPIGCQILVTVPHILQIMLLAPSNAKSWSERVKWIIFDEVHCMGQAEDGLIWEQLLLQAPCPIIALSATIGNPGEFNAWLSSTQKANNLLMVQHPHRYSDLRKFAYTPTKSSSSDIFEGLSEQRSFGQLGLDDDSNFTFLHPVASLINRARGIPDDFSLEARDCYTLWQSMSKFQTPEYPVDKTLDPSVALPNVIKKIDIINWAAALKEVLRQWLADNDSPFEAIFKDLSDNLSSVHDGSIGTTPAALEDSPESEVEQNEDQPAHSAKSTLKLLATLHEQDALPGIIFNYDRGLCEKMCSDLLAQLSSAEAAWKETNPKWQSTLKKWEDWKKLQAKTGKKAPKAPKKKGGEEGLTKEDMMRENAETEQSPWASFDPEKPVDGFHFANRKRASNSELDRYEKDLTRRDVSQWLMDALRRGIGVHHAGMNRKYRHVVEVLFRKGYLRVVIATGTLALGINMPCKTVVFSGDSIFLTALNYRQAAGRAGRRGFDMLGNVVFHGVPPSKIHRLISSRLPDLNGHFPITTTLVLRLFTLLHESKEAPFAIRSVNTLLSQPRLYLGGNESQMTVLHHLRFSIEYLRRQQLLDSRGAPLNFAGAISHLYFTENSSFAFHALLRDGYFHKLCAGIENSPEPVLRELMLTMAHLFGRQYCSRADEEFIEEVVKRSLSIVFLPPMPEKAADVLRKHNTSTLDIFTAYVRTFVEQHVQEADDKLPLSNVKVSGESSGNVQETKVRSSFVALSGHDDKFKSIHDLCTTTRSGVFLEEAVVPYVGIYPEESELPLNAYLYDFFIHGDVEALATANRVRRGDVWFVLNDFSMVLATIETSLSNFMNLTSESDLSFTDIRGEGEDAEGRQEDNLLPQDDSGYETGSTISMASKQGVGPNALPIQLKKKKKVADSWDDEADEEDIEDEVAAKEKKREDEMQKLLEKPDWEEGTGLLNVLKSFKMLRAEFDTKFRAMWA